MCPVIRVFGQTFSAYLLFGGAACAAFWILFSHALRRDLSGRRRFLLPPAVILASLLGARLFHAALHPTRYGPGYPIWTLRFERLYLMGGLILGAAVLYAVCHEAKLPFSRISDDLTPAAGCALVLLKVGCFLNGCCGGKPTTSPFGMVFPARAVFYDLMHTPEEARRVWPVQLFECAAYLLGIAALLLFSKKRNLPDGGRFLLYAAYVSAVRLTLHPLREAVYPAAWKILYPALYGALLAISAVWLILRMCRRIGPASS
ncbi:MAG: hypothetical protein E7576_06425 [Ruminococcaceae bacterium]|jgi:phosphatidylglycerol:prolipoprotein diacylglycerol transferase|nr:hypothetical protein [Oscillospiraceae bacterium]